MSKQASPRKTVRKSAPIPAPRRAEPGRPSMQQALTAIIEQNAQIVSDNQTLARRVAGLEMSGHAKQMQREMAVDVCNIPPPLMQPVATDAVRNMNGATMGKVEETPRLVRYLGILEERVMQMQDSAYSLRNTTARLAGIPAEVDDKQFEQLHSILKNAHETGNLLDRLGALTELILFLQTIVYNVRQQISTIV